MAKSAAAAAAAAGAGAGAPAAAPARLPLAVRNPLVPIAEGVAALEPLETAGVLFLLLWALLFRAGGRANAALRRDVEERVVRRVQDPRWRVRVIPKHRRDVLASVLERVWLAPPHDLVQAELEHPADAAVAPAVFGLVDVHWWDTDRDLRLFSSARFDADFLGRGVTVFVEHEGLEPRILTPELVAAVKALPPGSLQCVHVTDQFDFAENDHVGHPWRGVKVCVRVPARLGEETAAALVRLLDEAARIADGTRRPDFMTAAMGEKGFASRERLAKLLMP